MLELVAADGGPAVQHANLAGDDLATGRPAGLDPLIDPRAKQEYRVRIEELRADLEEARRFNDDERAAMLEEELDALVGELRAPPGWVAAAGRARLPPSARA